jgi:molybdopterin-guanine dinucleotide biosynthesis protein A
LHPVFLAIKTDLQMSLQNYLDGGHRKMMDWIAQQNVVSVDFSNEPEIFRNINTMDELVGLADDPSRGCIAHHL